MKPPYEVVRHTEKVFRFTGSWCSAGLWKGQNFKTVDYTMLQWGVRPPHWGELLGLIPAWDLCWFFFVLIMIATQ